MYTSTKIIILAIIITVAGYFTFQVLGGTFINKTLDRANTNLEKGLVGHWTFDGKNLINNVTDSSGKNNNVALMLGASGNTSTTTASGKIGQALLFDGVDDYARKSSPSSIPNTNQPMSISLFVNATSTSGVQNFIVINDITTVGGGSTNAVQLGFDSSVSPNTFLVLKAGGLLVVNSNFTPQRDTWHHLVYTYDGTTNSVYVDGERKNTSTTALDAGAVASVWFGTYNGVKELFQGKIDDARIYNRALSAKEVNRLYHLGATTKIATTIKPSSSSLESGLVGHWTLDGKNLINNVTDSSGQGNNGALTGNTATTTQVGRVGQALLLDGSTVVNMGDPANGSLDFGTNSFSYGIWVYATSSKGSYDMPISKGGSSAGTNGYDMELGAGSWDFSLADVDSATSGSFSGSSILNKWTHLFVVVDRNSNLAIPYVDGLQVGSGSSLTGLDDVSSGNFFRLGANVSDTNPFLGLIDDARVYNRALSAKEVNRLYHLGATTKINTTIKPQTSSLENGLVGHWTFDGKNLINNVTDSSGQGNNGNIIGQTSTTTTVGKIGQALLFDGVNDYVDIPDIAVPADFTISAWVNASMSAADDIVIGSGATAAGNTNTHFGYNNGNEIRYFDVDLTPDTASISISTADYQDKWRYITVTKKGTATKIYSDGDLLKTTTQTGVSTLSFTYLGVTTNDPSAATQRMHGSIDDLRVYNRALSADEIKRLYKMGR